MDGILYGVGVGPGDPELMTLKAVRLIKENNIIALPGEKPSETTAYQIAVAAVPELADKQLIPVHMPMTQEKEIILYFLHWEILPFILHLHILSRLWKKMDFGHN